MKIIVKTTISIIIVDNNYFTLIIIVTFFFNLLLRNTLQRFNEFYFVSVNTFQHGIIFSNETLPLAILIITQYNLDSLISVARPTVLLGDTSAKYYYYYNYHHYYRCGLFGFSTNVSLSNDPVSQSV